MAPALAGVVVFVCTITGALLGMRLRRKLPDHHVNVESRDAMKLCIGLIATMTALVLGLITASAKSHFDSVSAGVARTSVDILTLDRLLARYGPETREIRSALKTALVQRTEVIWPQDPPRNADLDASRVQTELEAIPDMIRKLTPADERQRELRTRAGDLVESLLQVRWLAAAELEPSIPLVFVATLLCWLTVTFTVFGLVAPENATVRAVFLVSALSVGSAVFLLLEMDSPFRGLLRIHGGPMRFALTLLGQ